MERITNKMGRRTQRNRRIVQFILMALGGDILLLGIEAAAGLNPFTDMAQRPILYVYVLLGTVVAFGVFGAMVGSREDQLQQMALRDSLTGLYNGRYLQMRLREELAAAKRYHTPVSFVLFDIDHFKQVNDVHGHPVGDLILQRVGQLIQSELRKGEIAARIGGEEFALLLPHTIAQDAAKGAERIRETIHQAALDVGSGNKLAVTVSAGIACTTDHDVHSADPVYRIADKALYQAKEQGRNRVVIAQQKIPWQ